MAEFVILEHDWPKRHWDFLVECGVVLRAWRLAEEPAYDSAIPASGAADHRRMYLDYEGPVSGGRGVVRQWDRGSCTWLCDERVEVAIQLAGRRLAGVVTLKEISDGAWIFFIKPARCR